MGEHVRLHGGQLAPLSIGLLVSVCAYPSEPRLRTKAMNAFAAMLELHGYTVTMGRRWHPAFPTVYPWHSMSRAAIVKTLDAVAYRLLTRRFAATKLSVLRDYRRHGMTVEAVHQSFHDRYLYHGNRVIGLYSIQRGSEPESRRAAAENVGQLVWRESRPVLHLAYAIQAELQAEDLSTWDWPLLAATREGKPAETPDVRLRRMLQTAENWQRAVCSPARNGAGVRPPSVTPQEQITLSI